MDAVRPGRERHVDPVVDHHPGVVRRDRAADDPGQLDQLTGGRLLVTDLEPVDAGGGQGRQQAQLVVGGDQAEQPGQVLEHRAVSLPSPA
ncbi:MAG: hypothetical protein QM638_19250 [Nocardioides sp.]